MRRKKSFCFALLLTIGVLCSTSLVFAAPMASVYLGLNTPGAIGPTGADIDMSTVAGENYTFDVYINVPNPMEIDLVDTEIAGLFGAGILLTYNTTYFSLGTPPVYGVDNTNFTVPGSKIIPVSDNSFAFYVFDEAIKGLTGEIHVGDVTFLALTDCIPGDWLIRTGDFSLDDDFIVFTEDMDPIAFDCCIDFNGANCVPIPSTVLLFGGGLLGLIGIGRRRMRKS